MLVEELKFHNLDLTWNSITLTYILRHLSGMSFQFNESEEEEVTKVINELYTVCFEESEDLFGALEKEIEEVLEGADQQIDTFSSPTIEEAVGDKFAS